MSNACNVIGYFGLLVSVNTCGRHVVQDLATHPNYELYTYDREHNYKNECTFVHLFIRS